MMALYVAEECGEESVSSPSRPGMCAAEVVAQGHTVPSVKDGYCCKDIGG